MGAQPHQRGGGGHKTWRCEGPEAGETPLRAAEHHKAHTPKKEMGEQVQHHPDTPKGSRAEENQPQGEAKGKAGLGGIDHQPGCQSRPNSPME